MLSSDPMPSIAGLDDEVGHRAARRPMAGPARWWRLRALDLRTPGIWDVGLLEFEAPNAAVIAHYASGWAAAGYEPEQAFTAGDGWWGGRPDRAGDGTCSIGVEFESAVVPSSIVLTSAPSAHRALKVVVECSDDGATWRAHTTADLDAGQQRQVVFYAPANAGVSHSWHLVCRSSHPNLLKSLERTRFVRGGVDLDAGVAVDSGSEHSTVTVSAGRELELDRIFLDLSGVTGAVPVLLERVDASGARRTWRHFGALWPGRHSLLLHENPLESPPSVQSPSGADGRGRAEGLTDRRIRVLIAAYRDPELAATVRSALTQAAYPEHLRFAICHQYDDRTRSLLDPWIDDPCVDVDEVHHHESRGCCWARHRTFAMYQDEPYVLQIDAHTRFAARWDIRYIEMLESLESPRPVLTTYPPHYTVDEDGSVHYDLDSGVQRLYVDAVRDDLTTLQRTCPPADLSRPGPSPTLAAGQVFTRGTFCLDVEYDPEMYFAGEEISMAARAFTAGYDLFYPNENLIWHRYDHDHPKHWDDHREHREMHTGAVDRLRTLFRGDPGSLGRYGLGSVRTIAEFEHSAEIDLGVRRVAVDGTATIEIDRSVIEPRDDYEAFVLVFLDRAGSEVARHEIHAPDVLGLGRSTVTVTGLPVQTSHYLVVPRSRGGRIAEIALRPIPMGS